MDAHEVLLHPVEQRGRVELSAVLLHVALSLMDSLWVHVHSRNLHARIDLLIAELMAATRAEPHGDHAMTLRALQFLQRIVASALFVHREQLALAHAAETDLLLAVRARQAPIRARKTHPALRIALLRRAAARNQREAGRKPVGSGFVDVGIDAVEGNRLVGIVRLQGVHEGVVVGGDRVAVEGDVAVGRVEDGLFRTRIEVLRGNTR